MQSPIAVSCFNIIPIILPEIQVMHLFVKSSWRGVVAALAFAALTSRPLVADEPTVEVLVGPSSPAPAKDEASELNAPFAMEFTADGDMMIVEYDGGRVWSWREGQGLTHLAGDGVLGYVDGPAKQARFNKLHNLVIMADGVLILSEHLNHTVRKYDPATKTISTLLGNGKPGSAAESVAASSATFNQPICVALTPDRSSLLIADIGNRRIRRLHFESGLVTVVAGNGERGVPADGSLATASPLVDPRGAIQNEAGEIFLIERGGHALRKIDTAGKITTLAGDGKAGHRDGDALKGQLNGPKHLCFGPDGSVFMADDTNHAVRRYDPRAKTLTTVDLGDYKLNRPHGVCVHQGWLYIADSYHHRVLRVKL
ncbi:MAG: hypothetical protein ACO1RT_09955 [Planctomycetaceae bacterium]